MTERTSRIARLAAALCAGALLLAQPAAAETLRVGKATAAAFPFSFIDVGMDAGIFRKHGIELEVSSFVGGAKLVQAMTAGDIDIGLDGGSSLAATLRGAPVKAVAAIATQLLDLCVIVRPDIPAKSGADLKGLKITASSLAGLPAWAVRELSRQQGWGSDGIELLAVPSPSAWPLMKTKAIDGMAIDLGSGIQGEKKGLARVVVRFNEIVKNMHMYHVSATTGLIDRDPALVRRFVAAWLESVAYAKSHRDEAVRVMRRTTGFDAEITAQLYDALMPAISANGHFDRAALGALARSLQDMKLAEGTPDLGPTYTEAFLPK
jgi:NitT/TauT family transport system substrate-binding protein